MRHDTLKRVPKRSAAITLLAFMILLCSGCGGVRSPQTDTSQTDDSALSTAYTLLRHAVTAGRWKEASQYSHAALIERPEDPEVMFLAAKVAFHNDDPRLSTELLASACSLESYVNDNRVHQAVVTLLSMGRLYDSMELLEETVRHRPEHHLFRRRLVDFYAMAERPEMAAPHQRVLVQQRRFYLSLLLQLASSGPRTLEEDSVQLLVDRNPQDLRPLLAKAKRHFDQRRDDLSMKLLEDILDRHPDFAAAHALAISVVARSVDPDSIPASAAQTPTEVESYVRYWIALGDWAICQSMTEVAVRCYWEGTRRDANNSECWIKLSSSLQRLSGQHPGPECNANIRNVQQRASLLNRLDQQIREFTSAGANSQRLAIGIAKTLWKLGRRWESEAWAAIALTFKRDRTDDAAEYRSSVVQTLRRDTPWQVTQTHPELTLDLSEFDLPRVHRDERTASSERVFNTIGLSEELPITKPTYKLINQAAERGINFFGYTHPHLDQPGFMLHHTLGCGGGVLDYDLDGWSDVYLAAAGGTPRLDDSKPNALFRNHSGRFLETTAHTGVGGTGFSQGVAIGDINEDGFPDIVVFNFGRNVLYVNQGDGSFVDRSDRWWNGDQDPSWSTSGAIVDFDGDGLSDLISLNYCTGDDLTTHRCVSEKLDAAPSCSPMAFPADEDHFLRGMAEGRFADRADTNHVTPDIIGRGLGIVAGSLDADNGIDVFIANDMTNNHYWSIPAAATPSPKRMREFAMMRGLASDAQGTAQGSMGIAVGDSDQDGYFDLFVTNFSDESNVLHRYRGRQGWVDDTNRLGLASNSFPLVAFGTQMLDLDNDGQLEIAVTNGHVQILSPTGVRADYAQPFQIYQRSPRGNYHLVSPLMQSGYVDSDHVGRALWTIDANRDAKTDVFVTHQTEPVALLINESTTQSSWVEIQLTGTVSARDAIGATVELRYGNKVWKKPLTAGDGYLCSNERLLRFGLQDPKPSDCSVTVHWPSGHVDSYDDLTPNLRWLIVESQEITSLD
ncbi:ASPIC/UnbV domain-containing protein [Rhodopirellula maiorica SM1]|uniref:ASPIC/UnbV domain-containing protein n=2 Tax=Novipirellula TaxID=2795426 RepID=M5RUC9_9BACT|nr:ASPIC/UnbV domain-containing protein [Rhodopirellula maiorica SM1]